VAVSKRSYGSRQRKIPGGQKGKVSSAAKRNPFESSHADKASADNDVETDENDWELPSRDDQIAVRISPALRAKLMAIKLDRRVKMICVRIDSEDWIDVVLEVREVRRLKD
jgi:hypothetical protein